MSQASHPRPNPAGPLSLMGLGLLLLLGALVMGLRPTWTSATPTAPPPEHAEDTFPEIPRVSLVDARAAFEAQSAVFVDVRDPGAYAASRIPGARSFPLAELESRLGELSRAEWIITYCT